MLALPVTAPDVEPVSAPVDAAPSPPLAEAPVAEPEPPAVAETAAPDGAPASPDGVTATAAATETAPAEPDMIEVWRPGRPQGERRPRDTQHRGRRRHDRPGAKPEGQPAGEAPAAVTADGQPVAADAAPPAEGERRERQGRPRHRRRDRGRDGQSKPAEGQVVESKAGAEARTDRPPRQDRPPRTDRPDRQGRPERRDRPDRKEGGRPPRRDRDRDRAGRDSGPDRIWGSSEEPRSNKDPDPNSPFAKLLALKAQLEGNKER